MLALASPFPADFEYTILPSHEFVMLSFRMVTDAEGAAATLRRLGPTLEMKPGDHQKGIVIKSAPPEVSRRNNGLLPVFNVCLSIAAPGEVKSIPRACRRTPRTIYLINETLDTQRQACTVYWGDNGDMVEIKSGLSQEVQDAVARALGWQPPICAQLPCPFVHQLPIPSGLRPRHRYSGCHNLWGHNTLSGALLTPYTQNSRSSDGRPLPCLAMRPPMRPAPLGTPGRFDTSSASPAEHTF